VVVVVVVRFRQQLLQGLVLMVEAMAVILAKPVLLLLQIAGVAAAALRAIHLAPVPAVMAVMAAAVGLLS
jgi:hypothetical protein